MFLNYSAPTEEKWCFLPWLLVKRLQKQSQQFFQNLVSVITEFTGCTAKASCNRAAQDTHTIIECCITGVHTSYCKRHCNCRPGGVTDTPQPDPAPDNSARNMESSKF